MSDLLTVSELRVQYPGAPDPVRAVDGVSFAVRPGESYALVGESGCGKSATALALLRLVEPGRIVGGRIELHGRNLLELSPRAMRSVRGGEVGMVFQEPAAALNPVMRVGAQVVEALRAHTALGKREAWAEAERLLGMVALPDPAGQARAYPHELSGGMKQRAMLAIALACKPSLLIADEPTTALDVTIQAQILALLRRLRAELNLALLLITHDMGVVAENADRVGVMYAGRLVEEADVRSIFERPAHPYTRALLASLPAAAPPPVDGDRRLPTLPGSVPDAAHPPSGCRFHPRCPEALARCAHDDPAEIALGDGRRVACVLHEPSAVAR